MEPTAESFWDAWERLRQSSDPDPLEVLRVAATFNRYFGAAEREAIAFARAKGETWGNIAEVVGLSRQAVWQRAGRDPALQARLRTTTRSRWEVIRNDPVTWYQKTRPFAV